MASETINQFPASGTSNGSLINTNSIVGGTSISNNFPTSPSSTMLKLSNIPSDLTQREATIIFSLVIDEIANIEMKDFQVFAYFKSVNTCITTGKLLDGKFIFGNEFGPVKVEYENLPINSPNSVASAFGSLRLSNSNVSPPGIVQPNPPTSASSANVTNAGNIQGFDNYQKRQSMGNQRSRFVFSDPFGAPNGNAANTSGGIDLSDITGKSLLMMESQNDAREYQNLVRDPWNSSNSALPINSAPQTPGISSNTHGAFDWSNSAGTSVANTSSDRRRTSSAFFNTPLHSIPNSTTTSTLLGAQQPNSQQQSAGAQPSSNGQQSLGQINIPNQNSVSINQQASNNSVSQPSNVTNQNIGQTNQPVPIQPAAPQQNQNSSAQNTSINQNSFSSSGSSKTSASKDVPDLSLLSRVPPPANPADQNPPCNTLYVGNLPPDATEAELRSLFSPQKGFRRLSFRTKNSSSSNSSNSNSHNHGPMCFVEFEDVAHATRALAELYGRALPRPNGGNGKGGIRLSFSKNPLGVRGPGNPRRSSANQVSASGSNSNSNGNGVGNYGYSNYHQK